MAEDAFDDDLFDDIYAGDVSSAPAPPQSIKREAPGLLTDAVDSPLSRQPVTQQTSYAPDTSNHIVAIDTGNEGQVGGRGVKIEPFQDEEDHNGDDGYIPIGIKEDG